MKLRTLIGFAILSLSCAAVQAVPVSILAYKLSDNRAAPGSVRLDAFDSWTNNTGSVNQGIAGATSLLNNGVDYKNGLVDTNWADVLSVRVSVWSQGNEAAYIEFNTAGTTKDNFFAEANISASTWTDIVPEPNNYFSIDGHAAIDRHWFINRNYGGCGIDRGWLAVIDRPAGVASPCAWENNRRGLIGTADRAFFYSNQNTYQNYNDANIGLGDVFAVHVTVDRPGNNIPEPATTALLGAGLLGMAGLRRRKS